MSGTPTRSSSFFSIIPRQAIRRGNFASAPDLIAAIHRFIVGWPSVAAPFSWTRRQTEFSPKLGIL